MQMNLALLGALFAYSLARVTTPHPLSDKQQLLKLEDECGRALKDEDRSTLDRILSPGLPSLSQAAWC